MGHPVICAFCGLRFDRDKEPTEKLSERKYAHKACFDKQQAKVSQDEKDYEMLISYTQKLFGSEYVDARIKKQIRDIKKDNPNYSYSGMQKTLQWWFEIRGNSKEKANGGIGIIPFVYEQAHNYFYSLYLAEIANKEVKNYVPRVKEVNIYSPEVRPPKLKLFKFEEEDDG